MLPYNYQGKEGEVDAEQEKNSVDTQPVGRSFNITLLEVDERR